PGCVTASRNRREISMPIDQSWRAFRITLSFLTVIPVRLGRDEATDADNAPSRYAYPVVGVVIGALLAGASLVLSRSGVAPRVSAFLLVASGVVLAGGLHLVGLGDSADGFFLTGGADRRLEAVRDPRVGSFGVTALILLLMGRYSSLEALPVS